MGEVGDLSALHDKYADLGFRVVAISDESRKKLEREMVEVRHAPYCIASDPGNKTRQRFLDGGDYGIPRFYLIDGKGVVVGNAIPTEEQLIALLAETHADLGRELPAALEKAGRAYLDGAFGEARRLADKAVQSKDADVRDGAKYLRERVDAYGAFVVKTAPAWLEDMRPDQVYGRVLLLSLQFEGTDTGKWAKSRLDEWSRDDAIKKEKKAWRKLAAAIERDLGSLGDSYQRKRARDLYQYVLDKHAYTRAADLAKERIERFDDVK